MSKYQELREQFPLFVYEGYEMEETLEEIHVTYRFQIPDLSSFAPEWRFPKNKKFSLPLKGDGIFQNLLFSLGMVELVSYWKICCPPKVEVRCGALDEEQVRWWKRLYYHGLGEFFYTNHITEADPESFMELVGTGIGIEPSRQTMFSKCYSRTHARRFPAAWFPLEAARIPL